LKVGGILTLLFLRFFRYRVRVGILFGKSNRCGSGRGKHDALEDGADCRFWWHRQRGKENFFVEDLAVLTDRHLDLGRACE